MKSFDKKYTIKQIFSEFEKIDQIHHLFVVDLENSIYDFVSDSPHNIVFKSSFTEVLASFAFSLINSVYGTLDKDDSYPLERMNMELDNMKTLLKRYPRPEEHISFSEGFSQVAKTIVTKHFPDLYNLSANGFRLLDNNINYNINMFLIYLYSIDKA